VGVDASNARFDSWTRSGSAAWRRQRDSLAKQVRILPDPFAKPLWGGAENSNVTFFEGSRWQVKAK
jgi:hypothetical protein